MIKQFFNRATLVALLVVGSLTACKQQTVDPSKPSPGQPTTTELSSRVTGQYTLKQISADGEIYQADANDFQGTAKITRVSASSVKLDFAINTLSTNEEVFPHTVVEVDVTDSGNNELALTTKTGTVAKVSSNKLTINIKGGDGVAYGLIMTK